MRAVIAGTGSAVGKTTISTGIMRALSDEFNVQPFKAGPDYIDPTYHGLATGNFPRNLDSFFMSDAQIRQGFENGMKISGADFGIVEGVRGLYEGISALEDVGSTASIAKALNAPVILILNSRSLVKSAAAIVIGFKTLDPNIKVEGVILNYVKNRKHYLKAKEAVEKLANTPVIGGIPRSEAIRVEERHLGLVPAIERDNILQFIEKWGAVMAENVDLDALMAIMKNSDKLPKGREPLWLEGNKKRVKIGVATDEVFSFYYKENFEALESNNAKIIPFSPLHDDEIPDVDGIYIGGGYPEIFAEGLESNKSMRESIYKYHNEGHPIYAECGGLMYLSKSINGRNMCNVFNYPSKMTKNVQALSYVISETQKDNVILKKGDIFRGHEFHYSKVDIGNSKPEFAFKIIRGTGIFGSNDGLMAKNTLANYVHTHVAACPQFALNFTRNASSTDKK
jgi:cobyrinic acid a,c-diamide synthase